MRRAWIAATAAILSASPLAAQDSAGERSQGFAPEEDLDCVIYIAAIMAETAQEMTPESRVALTGAMTYFVGRYEAQRAEPVSRALVDRYAVYAGLDPQAVEQTCSLRARNFSLRLQDAGRAMIERSAELSEEQTTQPAE